MAKTHHFGVLALAVFVALALVLVVVSPAEAILFGEPDNGEHPYVGMVGFYDEAGTPVNGCSGTLLSPTVFLTAGHCTAGMARARVWFDSQLDRASGFPRSGGTSGTPHTHPGFAGSADAFGTWPNTNDVGVIVLDEPVSMETYGVLPELGFLDTLAAQPGQEGQTFTVVGYGLEGMHPDLLDQWVPERQKVSTEFTDLRSALADGYNLRTRKSPETWGICYGDSGGPILLGRTSTVVAVASWALDDCSGVNGGYRTDIAGSQDFIRRFLG